MSQQQEQRYLMACLHKVSASTLQQLCDDASDTILIENNGDIWKLFENLNLEDHRRDVTVLILTLGVNRPLV